MKISAAVTLAIAAALGCPAAQAETPAPAQACAAYALPDTEVWNLAAPGGEAYRIFVSRPPGEAPEGGFPVLYVLDGNALFAGFAEARRIQSHGEEKLDRMIVVGIGYPGDTAYSARRLADFTPPPPQPLPAAQAKLADLPMGGNERFLSFIMDTLRPEIARRHPVNAGRQSLYGHSLGGLFALHVLYSRPEAFHAIIAASPSLWWDDQAILHQERAFTTRIGQTAAPGPMARLLLLVGERDAQVSIGDTAALGARLEKLSAHGLRSEFRLLDGETHISVPARSITLSLRKAMEWP